MDHAVAELRAWRAGAEYAQLNNFTTAEAYQFGKIPDVISQAVNIAENYKSVMGISDADLLSAIARALK